MKKIKLLTLALMAIFAGLAVSCTDYQDDIDALGKKYENHEERLKALETWADQANKDIASLKSLMEAMEKKIFIESYEALPDNSGYVLKMSDGSTIELKNGKTPAINAKQRNGKYYWTLDGEFLKDASGNYIPAQGEDGLAPQVRINTQSEEWEISTDGGKTWVTTGVKARGKDGKDFGFNISVDGDYILVKYNGTEYRFPKDGVIITEPKFDYESLPAWRMADYNITGGTVYGTSTKADFAFAKDNLIASTWYYNYLASLEYFEKPMKISNAPEKYKDSLWHLPSTWELAGIFPNINGYRKETYTEDLSNGVYLDHANIFDDEMLKTRNNVPEQIQIGYNAEMPTKNPSGKMPDYTRYIDLTTWYMADYWNTTYDAFPYGSKDIYTNYGVKLRKYDPAKNGGLTPAHGKIATDNMHACIYKYKWVLYGADEPGSRMRITVKYLGEKIEDYYNADGTPKKEEIQKLFKMGEGDVEGLDENNFPTRVIEIPACGFPTFEDGKSMASDYVTAINLSSTGKRFAEGTVSNIRASTQAYTYNNGTSNSWGVAINGDAFSYLRYDYHGDQFGEVIRLFR